MPPENCGAAEEDRAAGELRAAEVDRAAGELRAAEVDRAAGELRAAEGDRAAGELGGAEVAAVKDNAREVEVQALPGHRSVLFEVRGDDPNDGVADFADGLEGKSFRLLGVLTRIGLVCDAQIGA